MNNVFVYCEIEETTVQEVSQELLTKGRKLANKLGVDLHAIVAGSGIKGKVEDQILPYGVDKLYVFDGDNLFPYTSAPHTDILVNIYKEIKSDLGISEPASGDLSYWAKQGVLLLNATLSVSARQANSHSNFGWQEFTDAAIRKLSECAQNVVFMLWGNPAKAKIPLIDANKHLVLTAAHPSPLARGAFFGCRHFSKANLYLAEHGKAPIDWDLNNAV